MGTLSAEQSRRRTGRLFLPLLWLLPLLLSLFSSDANALSSKQQAAFVNNLRMIADRRPPYVWGGTDVQKGLDCSGYIYTAAKWTGFSVTRTTAQRMYDGFHGWLATLLPDKLRYADEGDLIFYDWNSGRVKHVGAAVRDLQSGEPSLLHASSSRDQTVCVPIMGTLAKPYGVKRLDLGKAKTK